MSNIRNMRKKEQENKPVEKAPDRIEILKKIQMLESEGKFDIDAEDDPPTIVLMPDKVDYLNEKHSSRVKTKIANAIGERFLSDIIKDEKLIIKEVKGIENMNVVKSGAVVTCNHFNPFDAFTMEKVFRMSNHIGHKTFYKVIREGNYTNFPGLYGFFFKHCDTLPLSSNGKTMEKFLKAVDTILTRGDFILIYPEQSLWWNYKKPKPLKNGAFKFAVKAGVPVIPVFITMEDTEKIGPDGFPVQAYTVHISEAIYPDMSIPRRDRIEKMKDKNYEIWKAIYEDSYGIPLKYDTKDIVDGLKQA